MTGRTLCAETNERGLLCEYVAGHPGPHVTFIDGWPTVWLAATGGWVNRPSTPADPLQDAPAALRMPPGAYQGDPIGVETEEYTVCAAGDEIVRSHTTVVYEQGTLF